MNEDVNVDVYVSDEKIGYLLLEADEIYIVYNDGTRELFEEAFETLINRLETLADLW